MLRAGRATYGRRVRTTLITTTTMTRLLPLTGAALVLLPLCSTPFALAGSDRPKQQVLQFDGTGSGHGVGLAQDSAFAMASGGAGREQVLGRFYRGTSRSSRGGVVRVDVWEAPGATREVTVATPDGATASGDHGAVQLRPGEVVRLSRDAAGYHARAVVIGGRSGPLRAAVAVAALSLLPDRPPSRGRPPRTAGQRRPLPRRPPTSARCLRRLPRQLPLPPSPRALGRVSELMR